MQEIAVSNVTAWDVNLYTDLNDDPQLFATSHSYKITWNGVQYNDLSIGRLLLLVGIARAEATEAILQNEMELLTRQTVLLESSCEAMNFMLSGKSIGFLSPFEYTTVTGHHKQELGKYLQDVLQIGGDEFYKNSTWGEPQLTDLLGRIKNRQDELNTISQKTTINIKDLVTKRNQAYLLETNALKRLLNDAQSTANNI
jgi:hypothetical protein